MGLLTRLLFGSFLVLELCFALVFSVNVHAAAFQDWQIEDGGGTYSESDGVVTLSGAAGNKNIAFYKQIAPTGDFSFSLQAKSTALMGFAIFLRSSLPLANSTEGVNFQFGEKEGGSFLLARWTSAWVWNVFASAQEDVWYTMILGVQKTPFKITAQVLAENGTSLGSYSVSDMTNLSFSDIKYLGFGVWESGSYSVRNIHSSLEMNTWIVDPNGTGDFNIIQDAIDAAYPGDTVFVKNGVYHEHLIIDKELILEGENAESTIIDAQGTDPQSIVVVSADRVVISFFTIRNSRAAGNAVWVNGYNGTVVSDNIIADNGDGVRLHNSHGNDVSFNVFQNNSYTALGFDWSYDNFAVGNVFTDNNIGIGAGNECYNSSFSENTLVGNGYGVLAAMHDCLFFHNNFTGNAVQASIYSSLSNTWDNGVSSGGNFWSDYNGTDANGDGKGDTAYVINAYNKDNYPLVSAPTPIPEFSAWVMLLTIMTATAAIVIWKRKD